MIGDLERRGRRRARSGSLGLTVGRDATDSRLPGAGLAPAEEKGCLISVASVIGIAIVAAVGFWLLGGVLMRIGGTMLVLAGGGALAITGNGGAVLLLLAGGALWLAGRAHHAVRHRA